MKKLNLLFLLTSLLALNTFSQKLQVSQNKRYLETTDGKPFLWIGDTAWELFHRLNREEAVEYLKNRKEKSFRGMKKEVTEVVKKRSLRDF